MSPRGRPPTEPSALRAQFVHLLPGWLAGAQLAGLVFFLNPELPFSPQPVLRAMLFYGGLLGAAFFVLLAPTTWGRRTAALRSLPWSSTTVLVAAALAEWFHAARFSLYLPPGINVRMIKAALWLSLVAIVFFYTALLHTLNRRPYGLRSRVGLLLLALASVYVVLERREAFERLSPREPLSSAVDLERPPSLMVVGLDGATLDALLPLAQQGRLPFFARLLEEGSYARLASFAPTEDSALWTTLATGRLPFQHGILGPRIYPADLLRRGTFLRLAPWGVGLPRWGAAARSSSAPDAAMRRSAALWEILSRLGPATGVLGWPAVHPAPPPVEFAFADRYFEDDFRFATTRPAELAERGVLFRVEAEELDPELTEPFGDPVPLPVLEALAGDLWRESLAEFLLDQRGPLRALFVRMPGLLGVSRGYFGGYSAAQFDGVRETDYQAAARYLTAYYQHLDGFVEELWSRAAPPRLLAVVSAFGVEAPRGWRRLWATMTGTALRGSSHRAPDGVLLLFGDGIAPGGLIGDAELIDLAPTLLYALGLPVARDLDGRVLTAAFDGALLARRPLTFVPSYETLTDRPPRVPG